MKTHNKGIALAATGSLLISLDSLGLRLTDESAWNNAFWLGLFIALAMFVLVPIRTGRSLPAVARSDGPVVIASAALQVASTSFFILAIANTAVSNVVAIIAAVPMLAALVAHFVIKERTPLRTWIAIGAAVAGVLVIVAGSLGAGNVVGDLFAVMAIMAFAFNLTIWRRFPEMNRLVIVGLSGLGLMIVSFIPANPGSVSLEAIVILALLGIVTGPAGRIAISSAPRYLPAAQVGLFVPVETVAATTWAWLFLDETPPSATIIGGLVVIAAVVFGVSTREDSEAITATPV